MLTSRTRERRNMSGYFIGLSSPSVTDRIITLACSPRLNSAGQTRLPTFSITSRSRLSRSSAARASLTMAASRWHPPWVFIWTAGTPRPATRFGVPGRLDVAFDHADPDSVLEVVHGSFQKAGLARARTGHEIEGHDPRSLEQGPVFPRRYGCWPPECFFPRSLPPWLPRLIRHVDIFDGHVPAGAQNRSVRAALGAGKRSCPRP